MTAASQERAHTGGWTAYAPLDASVRDQLVAALNDVIEGARRWRSWSYLALEAVKNQYRRTVLGPWWLTLQTAAYVVGLGVIFGQILHTPLHDFLPYVAVGFIIFNLLAGMTSSGAAVFVNAASVMKSTRQPLSNYVFRDVAIVLIQFAHNILIYVVFVAARLVPLSPKMLIAVPMVVVLAFNGVCLGLWLGSSVARFRDVLPLVGSVLQILIFFTPVFYKLSDLNAGARNVLLAWNPFTYLLSATRAPLIGAHLSLIYYVGAAVVTMINACLALVLFTRMRSRIPYWVA